MNNPNPGDGKLAFARFVVCMAALVVTLLFTASNFDETELIVIGIIFLIAAGVEGVPQLLYRYLPHPPAQQQPPAKDADDEPADV